MPEGAQSLAKAFRWTESEGMVLLGGVGRSTAVDVSADGSAIVGMFRRSDGFGVPYLWTQAGGIQQLDSLLASLGADVAGWHLGEVVGISDDGLAIVGNGSFRSGLDQAWIAVIPEPSTVLLLGFGLGVLAALSGPPRASGM